MTNLLANPTGIKRKDRNKQQDMEPYDSINQGLTVGGTIVPCTSPSRNYAATAESCKSSIASNAQAATVTAAGIKTPNSISANGRIKMYTVLSYESL